MATRWTSKIKDFLSGYWNKIYEIELYMLAIFFVMFMYSIYKIDFKDTVNKQNGVSWKNVLINEHEYRVNKLKLDSYDLSEYFSSSTNGYRIITSLTDEDKKKSEVLKKDLYNYSNDVGFAVIDKRNGNIYTNREWLYDEMKDTNKTAEKILDDLGYVTYYTTDNVKTYNFFMQKSNFASYDKNIIGDFKEIYFIRNDYYATFITSVRAIFVMYIVGLLFTLQMIYKIRKFIKSYGINKFKQIIYSSKLSKNLITLKIFVFNLQKIIHRYRMVLVKSISVILIFYVLMECLHSLYPYFISIGIHTMQNRIETLSVIMIFLVFIIAIMRRFNFVEDIIRQTEQLVNGDLNSNIHMREELSEFSDIVDNINSIREGYKIVLSNQLKNERLKTELITNVSHDLRTPLTSIINYVDILKRKDISEEERRDYLEVLSNKSYKLKTLIDDLFEISKISSGKVKLDMQQLDIVELMYQTLGEYTELCEEKKLQFKIKSPDSLISNLDGYKISRVLSNLAINSIKYSVENTRVYIEIVDEGENIKIAFKNTACYEMNFDSDEIFERFVRGDKSRNSDIEGSGLGLAIARNIVELHKGTMKVEIEGDMFKVYLKIPK